MHKLIPGCHMNRKHLEISKVETFLDPVLSVREC